MAGAIGLISIYRGVPLVKNKAHRILLNSELEFINGLNTQYLKQTYPRTIKWDERQKRVIRLQGNAMDYFDCNYLRIVTPQTNGTEVNLFAFIDEIQYVNDSLYDVHYSLDLFTSYIYNMVTTSTGYIVRHHVNDDRIGINKTPENIDKGVFLSEGISNIQDLNDTSIVVSTTIDLKGQPMEGDVYGGVYCGGGLLAFKRDRIQITLLQNYMRTLNESGKLDAIQSIFIAPSQAVPVDSDYKVIPSTSSYTMNWSFSKQYGGIDGYIPKNNKLYTYPYNYLLVSNNQGESIELEFDLFTSSNNCDFNLNLVPTQGECVMLRPNGYAGGDFIYSLGLGFYPSVSWINDPYSNWIAQTQNTREMGIIKTGVNGLIGVGLSAATGNVVGAVGATVNTLMDLGSKIAEQKDRAVQPNMIRGSTSFGNLNIAMFRKTYQAYHTHVSYEFAKIIDNFFSAYGYSILQTGKPNFYGRRSWNFVQVYDYPINGYISSEARDEINNLLSQGVTLWHTWDVGNYDLDNSII